MGLSAFEEKMFQLIFNSKPVDYTDELEANLMTHGPRTGEHYGKGKESIRTSRRSDEPEQG